MGLNQTTQQSANFGVVIKNLNNVEYVGEVYVGSEQDPVNAIYSTKHDETSVLTYGAEFSSYDVTRSTTAQLINDNPGIDFSLDGPDSVAVLRKEYAENICLQKSTGLCADKFDLFVAQQFIGLDIAQGIIGLAPPQDKSYSIVH